MPRWRRSGWREIARAAVERHGLCAAAVEHRVGDVPLSEPSVVVAARPPHRGEAFAGAREIIDRVKAEAPIWKKEVEPARDAGWRGARPREGAPARGGRRRRRRGLPVVARHAPRRSRRRAARRARPPRPRRRGSRAARGRGHFHPAAQESWELLTLHARVARQGTGTALVEALVRAAAAEGAARIRVTTTNDNLDALRFYQRRGFRLSALPRRGGRRVPRAVQGGDPLGRRSRHPAARRDRARAPRS